MVDRTRAILRGVLEIQIVASSQRVRARVRPGHEIRVSRVVQAYSARLPADGGLATGPTDLPQLTTLPQPVLLLNADSFVVSANQAGRDFLDEADGGSGTVRALRASTLAETNYLRRTVAEVANATAVGDRSKQVTLHRGDRRGPVAVLLMRWREGEVLAIVHQSTVVTPPDAIRFEMTTAESALAEDLLQGLRLKDIATRRGRSVNTIRSQLAAIMKKTGTSSQANLVRILMQRR